ncbi:MJ0042-type zinc finger domain-containing protein [Singulisphaera sp. PoT]|uniref:MJ0042-type zinc finger domain-containing protein n=1 Tax=Singulisphaera sp. PoT TaxID=3411797 RepID=UPI003BF61E7F
MKISFACPSCAASGSVDASLVGRQVRCKHCKHKFTVPDPEVPGSGSEGYDLEGGADFAPVAPAGVEGFRPAEGRVFVPARGDEDSETFSRRKARREASSARPTRKANKPAFPWKPVLIRGGLGLLGAIIAVALFAPNGMAVAAYILIGLGVVMMFASWLAGAFGAFSEDFIYGFFYVIVPFYAAYYVLSRWEDLWIWFVIAVVGSGFILLANEMLGWAGAHA